LSTATPGGSCPNSLLWTATRLREEDNNSDILASTRVGGRPGRLCLRTATVMNNPIGLFDQLRQMYLRYLESPFDLRYPALRADRRALLDTNGRIYREPFIEPIPLYPSSGQTFSQIAQTQL